MIRRALLLALLASTAALAGGRTLGQSPHGDPGACAACHAVSEDGALGPGSMAPQTCLDCHPDADMHPVGVRSVHTRIPAGWPLLDGTVVCATCHAEPSCEADRGRVSPFFRGGVPERVTDFCFRCHQATDYQRANPHTPAARRDPADPSCSACHRGQPAPGAAVGQALLRLSVADEGCTDCHEGPLHTGLSAHLGREVSGSLAEDGRLSLDPEGRIRCYTCHEVHGDGDGGAASAGHGRLRKSLLALAAADAPAWATEAHDGETDAALLALPAADGQLCRACHGDGP